MKAFLGAILILAVISNAYGQDRTVEFDQPVDANQYIIRPGDKLTITFLKANIEPLKLVVDPEGRVIHGQLGMFDLSHKTLTEAKQILKTAIKTLYKVENVVISITDPLLVRFSITGAVQFPGFYEGYTSQRISDAVKLAGRILSDGSSRRIVFSGGPENIIVDLDRALHTGDLQYDPCLYAGYKILVPQKTGSSVQVIGEVNAPREIELLDSDDLALIISLAGGFRSWADSNNIQVLRNGSVLNAFSTKLQSGDIIKVNALSEIGELHKISVFGAVAKPGRFEAKTVNTIDELLAKSGGFIERAVPERTTAFRFRPLDASGRFSRERFAVQNIVSGSKNNFELLPGDSVFVPFSIGIVEVAGQVVNPGSFPYQAEMGAEYYIKLAGGYLPDADRTQVGIFDAITHITTPSPPKVKVFDGGRVIVKLRRDLE